MKRFGIFIMLVYLTLGVTQLVESDLAALSADRDAPCGRTVTHLVEPTDCREHITQPLHLQVAWIHTVQDDVHHLNTNNQSAKFLVLNKMILII